MKHSRFARSLAAWGLLAVISALVSASALGQAQGPIQQSFTLTAAGQRLPTIPFTASTQSCAIVVYGSGGGFTLVPQVASDAVGNPTPTWVTATTINSGSISATGSFVGNVSPQGLTAFGGVLSALTSGTITGTISCSSAIGSAPVTITSLPPPVQPSPLYTQPVSLGTTPLPAPTATVGVMLIDSAGTNKAAVDSNGRQATRLCDATTSTQCASVTAGGLFGVQPSYQGGGNPIYGITLISNACGTITSATTTLCRGLVVGQKIYVTSYIVTAICTTACSVVFTSGTQTTTPCDTSAQILSEPLWFPNGSGQLSSAPGLGLALPPTAAGFQLCVTTTGTITDLAINAMGSQF